MKHTDKVWKYTAITNSSGGVLEKGFSIRLIVNLVASIDVIVISSTKQGVSKYEKGHMIFRHLTTAGGDY